MKQNKLKSEFPLKSIKCQGRSMASGWWQSCTNSLFQEHFFHCGFGKQLITNSHESPNSHPQTPLFHKITQEGYFERFVLIWVCWYVLVAVELKRQRQEDYRLKAILDYTVRPLLFV